MFIPLDYQLVLASPWRHDRLCNDTEYLLWQSGNQWSRLPKGSEKSLVNNFPAHSFFALILNLCAPVGPWNLTSQLPHGKRKTSQSKNRFFDSLLEIEKGKACKPHKELLPVGPLVVPAPPENPLGTSWEPLPPHAVTLNVTDARV